MKPTGIIRRIDDLGRIVIPKEIRRNFHLHEGDPLELLTTKEGILLRNYCFFDALGSFRTSGYAVALRRHLSNCANVTITSLKSIIARSPDLSLGVPITLEFEELIRNRRIVSEYPGKTWITTVDTYCGDYNQVICPLVAVGKAIGSIVARFPKEVHVSEDCLKAIELAAALIVQELNV